MWLTEMLPGLVVLLVCLMQVRHWSTVLTYRAIIRQLREELAFSGAERRIRETDAL